MPRVPNGFTIEAGTGQLVRMRSRVLTVTQFMSRISLEEYVALNAMIMDPSVPIATRAQLQTLKDIRDGTKDKLVDLDHPSTPLGVALSIGVLAALPEGAPGRIAPADISARITAWLADFPQPGEVE